MPASAATTMRHRAEVEAPSQRGARRGLPGGMTGVSGPRRVVLWVFCQLPDSMDALDTR